jgi:methylmalonyl-CoA mutase C-terminal domain/subunit
MSEGKIKVLTSKLGFDIHNRGITLVNMALRDAGMEVIFIGNQFPKQVVEASIQEDVDVIGVSILSSTYMEYITELTQLIKEKKVQDKMLVVGGIVLPDDVPHIKEMGVAEYFPPGTALTVISEYIAKNAARRSAS